MSTKPEIIRATERLVPKSRFLGTYVQHKDHPEVKGKVVKENIRTKTILLEGNDTRYPMAKFERKHRPNPKPRKT